MLESQQKDATDIDIDSLRSTWKTLYASTLPSLARAKDPAQQKWPVTLDHCFARIILDNIIGKGAGPNSENVQWDRVLSKPAVQKMSATQLRSAIELGQKIWSGEVDLVELDRASLECRGKQGHKYSDKQEDEEGDKKRRRVDKDTPKSPAKRPKHDHSKTQSTLMFSSSDGKNRKQLPSPASSENENNDKQEDTKLKIARSALEQDLNITSQLSPDQVKATLKRIQTHPGLTPFRRRLYTALLSVPRGSYTTYAAMATHLNSVARAVGNGMRHNPFAPDVPCHRVLASDRTIGGFCGDWGRDGKNTALQDKKLAMLREEGVKFDSAGKVRGPVWKGFWDLEDFEREYGKVT